MHGDQGVRNRDQQDGIKGNKMSDFRKLDYHVMPRDQGQIVENSFAVDGGYLYQKIHDKSDGIVTYSRAEILEDSETEFEPQNNKLPGFNSWETYGRFEANDDGNTESIDAYTMEEAIEQAIEIWQDGSWDGKCLIEVRVVQYGWGDEIEDADYVEVECGEDPTPPDCDDNKEHDWCSPYEVVGGLKENPGVWSKGGTTFVFKKVCSRCGCVKIETNYGAQRNPSQCDTVEYDTQDLSALVWVGKIDKPSDEWQE